MRLVLALALVLLTPAARAEAPQSAPRPVLRAAVAAPLAPPSRPADLLAVAAGAMLRSGIAMPVTPPSRPDGLLSAAAAPSMRAVLPAAAGPTPPPAMTTLGLSTRSAPPAVPDWARVEAMLQAAQDKLAPPVVLPAAAPGLLPLPRPVRVAAVATVPVALTAPLRPLTRGAALPVPVTPVVAGQNPFVRPLSRPDPIAGASPLSVALITPVRPLSRVAVAGGMARQPAPMLMPVPQSAVLPVPLRPATRPVVAPPRSTTLTPGALIVPPSRPGLQIAGDLAQESRVALVVNPVSLSPHAIGRMVLPQLRPQEISNRVEARQQERMRGAVCGDPAIQGEVLGHVSGPGACGVEDAVLVRSVGGLRLSEPATLTCATARALADWVQDGALSAIPDIARIETMGSYTCRGRNGQSGARLSEHAFGRAVDIGGFVLNDGTRVTVLNDWNVGRYGRALRAMHRAACGTFGTVLGPEANAYHRNHFHFDTARYRSGAYCE